MSFFIGTFIILAAFAQMYYITNNFVVGACESPMLYEQDQDYTCTLSDTYFMTFASIVTGEWRFMQQPSTSPMTVISFSLAVFTILLLFTSLVGQIISLNGKIQEVAAVSFWLNRLYIIIEISDLNETFGCVCCRDGIAKKTSGKVDDMSRSLQIAGSDEPDKSKPLSRFEFSKAEQYEEFPDDEDGFRKWWVGEDERVPSLQSRVKYFVNWAPLSEVCLPGREMERVLSGHKKDVESYFFRLMTYVFCPIYISLVILIFVLGLCSFGLLWPKDMRRRIFCGDENLGQKHQDAALNARIDAVKIGVESIKADMYADHIVKETLEERVQNLHKKMDELTKLIEKTFEEDDDGSSAMYADTPEETELI